MRARGSLEAQTAYRCMEKACLRPGLNRGPSVYKTDALPLSHTGVISSFPTHIFTKLKNTNATNNDTMPQTNEPPTTMHLHTSHSHCHYRTYSNLNDKSSTELVLQDSSEIGDDNLKDNGDGIASKTTPLRGQFWCTYRNGT